MEKELIEKIKKFILEYHKENLKVPGFDEISKKFDMNRKLVLQYYRELVNTGFLKRNYSQYKYNTEKNETKIINKIKRITVDDIFIGILRFFMFAVGAGAIALSVFFTYNWGLDYLKSFFSLLLSVILVVFSVGAFQVFLIFIQNRQIGYSIIFIITWLIVLIFSMQSTVTYLYNTKSEKIVEVAETNKKGTKESLQYERLLKREIEKENEVIELKEGLKSFNDVLQKFNDIELLDENKKIYDDTYKKIGLQEKKIDKVEKELVEVRNQIDNFLEEDQEVEVIVKMDRKNFYDWVSGVLLVFSADTLEFVVSCFPAVFVDIVAPLSVAVSLFLKRRKKYEKQRYFRC